MLLFTALSIFLLVFCGNIFAADFVIFHTSDVHGAINAHPDPASKEDPKPMIGGYSVLRQLINKYRQTPENAKKRIMYLDCGDYFQGTPIVDRTRGAVMIDMMNRLAVDAATIGNHEFDYSYPNLVEQMKKRNFPVVCCNVFEKATGRLPEFAQPYTVFTHKGTKIGVIGIDTPETATISFEKNVKDVVFADPVPLVKPIIKKLRQAGVDFILVLSHLGFDADLKFAAEVEGIDLILGGHTHLLKKEIVWAEPFNTPVIHSGSSCEHAGVIHLNLDNPAEPVISFESVPLYVAEIGEDPRIKAIEDEYLKDLKVEMQKVIGRTEVNLFRGISGGDSPEGSLVADAMLKYSGADFAFINFGGVRQPFFKGDITVEDVFMVQPFDNYVEILEINGFQLRDLIERSLSNDTKLVDDEDRKTTLANFNMKAEGTKLVVGPDYGYLLPAGLKITFDPALPKMKRIVKLETDKGEDIVAEKIYKVALNDFVASGGDGFSVLKDYKNRNKMDLLVRDALIKYIQENPPISSRPSKRIFNTKLVEESLD
jgi:2',3'-cyclic-nucleotide 2'-phosphodiesterase (5'-nucleotidase family)